MDHTSGQEAGPLGCQAGSHGGGGLLPHAQVKGRWQLQHLHTARDP